MQMHTFKSMYRLGLCHIMLTMTWRHTMTALNCSPCLHHRKEPHSATDCNMWHHLLSKNLIVQQIVTCDIICCQLHHACCKVTCNAAHSSVPYFRTKTVRLALWGSIGKKTTTLTLALQSLLYRNSLFVRCKNIFGCRKRTKIFYTNTRI